MRLSSRWVLVLDPIVRSNSLPFLLVKVDALKYQLSALEQKLSSLESAHQSATSFGNGEGKATSELSICGAMLKCQRDVHVLIGAHLHLFPRPPCHITTCVQ
jgi:hypothetical protein